MFYNYPKKDDQINFGGGKENRTPDPLLAKQVLSQLSYTPILSPFPYLFSLIPPHVAFYTSSSFAEQLQKIQ